MAGEKMPKRRHRHLIFETIGEELLIFDRANHRAHCLNSTAAFVWSHCDGKGTIALTGARLAANASDHGERIVRDALVRLSEADLLVGQWPSSGDPQRFSRRDFARKAMVAGVLVPTVMTIVVPTAALAASRMPNGSPCNTNADCISGCCCNDNSSGLKNRCVTPGIGCNVCR